MNKGWLHQADSASELDFVSTSARRKYRHQPHQPEPAGADAGDNQRKTCGSDWIENKSVKFKSRKLKAAFGNGGRLPDDWKEKFLAKIEIWQNDESQSRQRHITHINSKLVVLKTKIDRLNTTFTEGGLLQHCYGLSDPQCEELVRAG